MYVHRVRKYIGSYVAVLGGVDVLVFTDDIGVRNPLVREKICEGMEWCGIRMDAERNRRVSPQVISPIGDESSPVPVLCVPTDEELVICLQGQELLKGSPDADI
jgi:acetate kinase